MNAEDRKAFSDINVTLGRIDEKTANIWRVTEKQEKHLEKLNGRVEQNALDINTVKTLQKERNKPSKKFMAGYISGVIAIGVALWKAFTGG